MGSTENTNAYSEITPQIVKLSEIGEQCNEIDADLFTRFHVYRGLRDLNGKGVLTGLTHISDIIATKDVDGESVPANSITGVIISRI